MDKENTDKEYIGVTERGDYSQNASYS